MSFELLDQVLQESGKSTTGKGKMKISEDADIYGDLDNLIEDAMRATLRSTIMESASVDGVKLEQLQVVEEAIFTESQTINFIQENIHPILQIMGITESSNYFKHEKVFVPLPVFEVASLVRMVLEQDEEDLPENDDEQKENEDEASDKKEGDVKEESASLYESVFGEQAEDEESEEDEKEDEKEETVEESLQNIFKFYGVDKAARRGLIETATALVRKTPMNRIAPMYEDVAELVLLYNTVVESSNLTEGKKSRKWRWYDTAAQKVTKGVSGATNKVGKTKGVKLVKKGASAAVGGVRKAISAAGGAMKTGAGKVGGAAKTSGGFIKKHKIAASVLGLAAAATAAALAYRAYKNRKCAGLEGDAKKKCKAAAYQQAATAAKSKMSSCSQSKNPDKCKKGVEKEVAKWAGKAQAAMK